MQIEEKDPLSHCSGVPTFLVNTPHVKTNNTKIIPIIFKKRNLIMNKLNTIKYYKIIYINLYQHLSWWCAHINNVRCALQMRSYKKISKKKKNKKRENFE